MAAAARLALLLLLLLGCVDLLQGVRYLLHCPPGWSYYKLSCFKYFRQLRSWDEAEAQCQASHPGAHLAWVEEPREAATLGKAISYHQRTQPVWIGLRSPRQRSPCRPRHVGRRSATFERRGWARGPAR
uniref:Regenerating family member 4 n=1 Tax=Apteryx owenii TaxID=8824 RepID=A0A8B9PYT1_APTOW